MAMKYSKLSHDYKILELETMTNEAKYKQM
jgi:hypothetical protein